MRIRKEELGLMVSAGAWRLLERTEQCQKNYQNGEKRHCFSLERCAGTGRKSEITRQYFQGRT
jgi:hypothetical protein